MGGILFIDAEQPFADQMVGVLKGKGFSVKLLDDGKDGLDYARDHRPDLIVLCVELPKMSGYSICNKLKKDNDLKSIPLIITSKEATPETFAQHKKLKTRAEDYLIKPFSDAELFEKIGAFIALPSGGAAGPAKAESSAAADPLEGLGADLNLGPSSSGGESEIKLDDSDLASLDIDGGSFSAASSSPAPSSATSAEDDLLASLDGFDDPAPAAAKASGAPAASIDEFDLGDAVKDDNLANLEKAFDIGADLDVTSPPPPPPRAEAKPEPPRSPPPAAEPKRAPVSTTPPSSTSSADFQQLQSLRRESSDLKAKVAELEARLKAAEDNVKSKDAQLQAAASGGGGGSSAREVLNLKEQLRAKDKEISALKDEAFEKDKSIVELQEQIDGVRAEANKKLDDVQKKDVEISSLSAKLKAVSDERDELEQQVQGRMAQAEAERDQLRGELDAARSDAQRLKADADKLKGDLDRARADLDGEKKSATSARQQLEGKVKELEGEARRQEESALKAFQRLKTEEAVREKAKKAVEIAFTLLSGDVETGGKQAIDLELDAE